MSPTTYFSPEEIHRMTAVYERAVQELNLERAPGHERDRLAVYVLSIGNIQDFEPDARPCRANVSPSGDARWPSFPVVIASFAFEPDFQHL